MSIFNMKDSSNELSNEIDKIILKNQLENYEKKYISYIVIQVKDDKLEKIFTITKNVCHSIGEHGGRIGGMFCSMILIFFEIQEKVNYMNKLINEIVKNEENNIKLIHGETYCIMGNIGNEMIRNYGPIIRSFSKIIEKFANLNYGETYKMN